MYSIHVRSLPVHNPVNPFAKTELIYGEGEAPPTELEVYFDRSSSILAKNDSPDLGFGFSVNPYRGCFHGCAYCYARPTHEYLSFGAGTDFERKIVVKPDAPELLRKALSAKGWRRDLVLFSGVTDCYQPLEARYELTRRCLEVCAEHATPAHVITKSPLVERDTDVLVSLAGAAGASVAISIPFASDAHARALEPFVTPPSRRFRTIERLAAAGVRVGVSVAPVIPGLGDEELPRVLEAAKAAGASFAGYVLLRLPGHVKEVFEARLRERLPEKAERVMARIRQTRGGKLYDAHFKTRGRGEGPYAQAIELLFRTTAQRLGLEAGYTYSPSPIQPAEPPQLSLFR